MSISTHRSARYIRRSLLASALLAASAMMAACGLGGASQSAAQSDSQSNPAKAAAPALDQAATADEARAALTEKGVLTIGTEGTYPPFSYHDTASGGLTGYDVEVVSAIAERLGVKPEFSEVKWDGLLSGLEAGRYEVVANQVAVTPERQEIYEFSVPYTVSDAVVIVRTDDTSITVLADVEGKDSAQSVTSNWAGLAREAGANVVPVDGFSESIAALRDSRVDLTFNDNLAVLDYFQTTGDDSVKVALQVQDLRSDRALVTQKGTTGLAELLSQTLDELRADGTLAEIGQKYFDRDVS